MGSHRATPGASSTPSTPTDYVGRRTARPTVAPVPDPDATTPVPYVGRRVAPAPAGEAAPTIAPTVEILLPTTARRAPVRRGTRAARTSRGPLRALPSAPVLLGVATLALAIGGALASNGPVLTDHHGSSIRTAGALTGLTGTDAGKVGATRGQTTSRSADRQRLQQAATPDTTASTRQIAQHDAAMDELTQAAQHQAARLNNFRWDLPIQVGVYHLTARFGDYTAGLWASFHTGLDFACPIGTPIHAVASGTVTFVAYDGSYGNKTVVTLPNGTEIWYAHQTTQYVAVGDTVTRGEVIGTVGDTGNTTGPHVHIEVRPDGGDPVDPFPEFVQHGVTP